MPPFCGGWIWLAGSGDLIGPSHPSNRYGELGLPMIRPHSIAAAESKEAIKMIGISGDNVVSAYRRYAPIYDFLFGAVLEQGRRKLAEEVARLAPATLLEIGVGTGLVLERYPSDTKITGIDISPAMLERARLAASRLEEHRIELHEMDAESLAFPDNSFDVVTVPYVLSVTPDPVRLAHELRRVCKPGGTILIANHFSGQRGWRWLERLVGSVANRIGFRSEFDFDQNIPHPDWTVLRVDVVNLFSLSRLVVIRNASCA